jgi:hypothetical protein
MRTNFKIFNKAVITMMALLFTLTAKSQTPGLGTWTLLNAKYDFDKKWNAYFEAQLRSQKFEDDFFYHELKGAVGYRIAPKANVLVGVGQYATYQYDGNFELPVRNHEFRLWEQLNLNHDIGTLKLEHRYRVEQRYFKSGYRNRFRYRINLQLPLGKSNFYLNGNEEIFVTNEKPYFERNRTYGALGYKFTPLFSLQLGYVTQFDYNRNVNPYTKHFYQTSLLFDLNDLKAKPKAE